MYIIEYKCLELKLFAMKLYNTARTYIFIDIFVPHVVYSTAGTAHHNGSQSKQAEHFKVWKSSRRRGQSNAPRARPVQQQPTWNNSRQPVKCVRSGKTYGVSATNPWAWRNASVPDRAWGCPWPRWPRVCPAASAVVRRRGPCRWPNNRGRRWTTPTDRGAASSRCRSTGSCGSARGSRATWVLRRSPCRTPINEKQKYA